MEISLITAHDPDLVIGVDGTLPWHYREDLAFFKRTTMGYPIVMGRRVFEDLGEKPLPGRRNVVLSRSREYDNVEVYRSLDEAFGALKEEEKIYIIGGAGIYRETIDRADELVITEIRKRYRGDTLFPEYRDRIGTTWIEEWREEHPDLTFVRYRRMK